MREGRASRPSWHRGRSAVVVGVGEFGVAYSDTEGLLQVDGVYLSLYIERRLSSPRSFYAALLRASLLSLPRSPPRRAAADLVRTVAAVTTLIQLQPEVVFGGDADAEADGANGAAEAGGRCRQSCCS